ncbi:MAG: hypothetical protein ACPL5F_01795 [Moorellaceae bacterium]
MRNNCIFLDGVCVSDAEEILTSWGTALRVFLQVQGFYGPVRLALLIRDMRDPQVTKLRQGVKAFVRGFLQEEDGEVWIEARGIFIKEPAGL